MPEESYAAQTGVEQLQALKTISQLITKLIGRYFELFRVVHFD